MKYLVTSKEMKLLDQNTSEYFRVPTVVLMEQAAMAFVRELLSVYNKFESFTVVCGSGNNGADGLAIARLLMQEGYKGNVVLLNDAKHKASELRQLQESIILAYGMPIYNDLECVPTSDVLIDAVFGVGLSREIIGTYAKAIEWMNEQKAYKVAVDLPSGVSADDGSVLGVAFRADLTITFSFGKVGQYLWPASTYCNDVRVVQMGITMDSWIDRKPHIAYVEESDLKKLPVREAHSNKGTYGKLLVIAGSLHMSGAAYFTAEAAYRTGVGIVKIFTPECNRTILQQLIPEAVIASDDLKKEMKWADAIVIGPGIGRTEDARELVEHVIMNAKVPVVADADAINTLADNKEIMLQPHGTLILTPHLGEFARLLNASVSYVQEHLVEVTRDFANTYDVICMAKDFRSVICVPFGMTYLNLAGNNGMATAGSGDVLAGIIGGLLCQNVSAENSAALGAFIHGTAGDYAKEAKSLHGMIASDIIKNLNKVWNKVEQDDN